MTSRRGLVAPTFALVRERMARFEGLPSWCFTLLERVALIVALRIAAEITVSPVVVLLWWGAILAFGAWIGESVSKTVLAITSPAPEQRATWHYPVLTLLAGVLAMAFLTLAIDGLVSADRVNRAIEPLREQSTAGICKPGCKPVSPKLAK